MKQNRSDRRITSFIMPAGQELVPLVIHQSQRKSRRGQCNAWWWKFSKLSTTPPHSIPSHPVHVRSVWNKINIYARLLFLSPGNGFLNSFPIEIVINRQLLLILLHFSPAVTHFHFYPSFGVGSSLHQIPSSVSDSLKSYRPAINLIRRSDPSTDRHCIINYRILWPIRLPNDWTWKIWSRTGRGFDCYFTYSSHLQPLTLLPNNSRPIISPWPRLGQPH